MIRQTINAGVVSLFSLALLAGCGTEPQSANQIAPPTANTNTAHDPHDVPLTEEEVEALKGALTNYGVALSKVKSYRDAIRDSIAAGQPTKAHRPLDELDVVLNHLPSVARASNIPKSEWETVNMSAQQLRDLFNEVHAQIDAGEEPAYNAIATDVDAAIGTLEGIQSEK